MLVINIIILCVTIQLFTGHAEVAELLLEYNANKDSRTKTGITPLFQVLYTLYVLVTP